MDFFTSEIALCEISFWRQLTEIDESFGFLVSQESKKGFKTSSVLIFDNSTIEVGQEGN